MIHPIIIPDLGATGGDVTLEEWQVQPGQEVRTGQMLFVVTTDKASVEVEAFRDGFIRELLAEVGQSLPVGAVVALMADSLDEPLVYPAPDETHQSADLTVQAQAPAPTDQPDSGRRILVSPLARRIAQREGIILELLDGSGDSGQILKRDVIAALSKKGVEPVSLQPELGSIREGLSPMQRAVAELTQLSKRNAPHFYASITIDMGTALETRRKAVEWADRQGWPKPTITDLCIKAAALSLRDFPMLNASFDGEAITTYAEINIGLVVGLEQGMLVPVVQRADRVNLFTLAETTQRLKKMAEGGKLSAGDLGGGTFTISNLGMFGLDSFTAVINPPQTGILALGAVMDKPVVMESSITARPQLNATLSVDHRVVDGITAARFMATFKEMLENPERLTLDAPQDVPK